MTYSMIVGVNDQNIRVLLCEFVTDLQGIISAAVINENDLGSYIFLSKNTVYTFMEMFLPVVYGNDY